METWYVTLLVLCTATFVAMLVVYLRHPAKSWFHPLTIYLFFHGLSFVVRPWLSIIYKYDLIYRGYAFSPSWEARCVALVATALGLVVFASAVLFVGNRPLEFGASPALDRREIYRPHFLIVGALLLPFFAYGIYLGWQYRMTDLSFTELDPRTGHQSMVGASGYAMGMFNLVSFFIPVFVWLYRFRWPALLIAGAVVLMMQGIGTRGPTVTALFATSCFYLYDRRRLWFDRRILIATIAAFFVFNFIGVDRGKAIRELFIQDNADTWVSPYEDAPLEGMDFGNLEMVEFLTNAIPNQTGTYEYFLDQLQIFTEPIPRALWHDKPEGQPIRLFYLWRYGTPYGMTRSLPGEGWANLGFLGVVLWCALWGFALGKFYNWFAVGPKNPFRLSLYFCILALMIVCYRDGLLLSVLRYSFFIILPLGAWRLLATISLGRSSPPAQAIAPVAPTAEPRARRRQGDVPAVVPRAWRTSG